MVLIILDFERLKRSKSENIVQRTAEINLRFFIKLSKMIEKDSVMKVASYLSTIPFGPSGSVKWRYIGGKTRVRFKLIAIAIDSRNPST